MIQTAVPSRSRLLSWLFPTPDPVPPRPRPHHVRDPDLDAYQAYARRFRDAVHLTSAQAEADAHVLPVADRLRADGGVGPDGVGLP